MSDQSTGALHDDQPQIQKTIHRQGQGPGTRYKEDGFRVALAASLRISKGGKAWRFPYWHIDLNAGSGVNDRIDDVCEGSPLIFMRAASASKRRFNAVFCDTDETALRALAPRVEAFLPTCHPASTISFRCLDNARCLEEFGNTIRIEEKCRFAVRTCLCDPNGYRQGFPEEALRQFSGCFPRIDLILSANVNLHRSAIGCRRRGMKGFEDWPVYQDILDNLNRSHWLVRNIKEYQGPGHRYIVVVGRNTAAGHKRFEHFFPRESPDGRSVLTHWKRAEVGQGLLFPEME